METMVSSSNNIEQEIYLWQDLVWSIQPGVLSCIVISIVVFFIMTLLYKKYGYYNNLLNGFLTILLRIISGFISGFISGIIFGKGLEILFRTLHICSGAYGNVVFSLKDIFISLLFGCIFVISGSLLLFNKKFYKQVRHLPVDAGNGAATVIELEEMEAETVDIQQLNGNAGSQTREKAVNGPALRNEDQQSENEETEAELDKILANLKLIEKAELEEMMTSAKATMLANDETLMEYRLEAMLDYLELTMVGKPKETVPKLKKIYFEIKKTVPKIEVISNEIKDTWNSLNEIEAVMKPEVYDELEKKEESIKELFSKLNQKLLNYELNEAGPEEIETELDEIVAGLDEIVAVFKGCKEILTEEKAAILAAAEEV
ncbi:hypothetical protein GINT2_000432 [Glugoides intestinalis]